MVQNYKYCKRILAKKKWILKILLVSNGLESCKTKKIVCSYQVVASFYYDISFSRILPTYLLTNRLEFTMTILQTNTQFNTRTISNQTKAFKIMLSSQTKCETLTYRSHKPNRGFITFISTTKT